MKLLRRWAPVVIGVLVAGLVAFGYAQIAPGIANQNATRRATLPQPAPGETLATFLDDGRPVFVVKGNENIRYVHALMVRQGLLTEGKPVEGP